MFCIWHIACHIVIWTYFWNHGMNINMMNVLWYYLWCVVLVMLVSYIHYWCVVNTLCYYCFLSSVTFGWWSKFALRIPVYKALDRRLFLSFYYMYQAPPKKDPLHILNIYVYGILYVHVHICIIYLMLTANFWKRNLSSTMELCT